MRDATRPQETSSKKIILGNDTMTMVPYSVILQKPFIHHLEMNIVVAIVLMLC